MALTFGNKIRQARKLKGYTQKELALMINAKHNSISDWENDKNKPDPDTIELLCGVLEISPNFLLANKPDEVSPLEMNIIKKMRELDDFGRESVLLLLDREWLRTQDFDTSNVSNMSHLFADAAHSRTDIDIDDSIDTSEDHIMDDKDF